MENPAQSSDLTDRGYSGTASTTVQQTWLDVSFRALRRELRRLGVKLEEALLADDLDLADVIDVVVSGAKRALDNPEGVKQYSGGIDDYTESTTLRDATEDVYFTTAELRRLTPAPVATGWSGSLKYSS